MIASLIFDNSVQVLSIFFKSTKENCTINSHLNDTCNSARVQATDSLFLPDGLQRLRDGLVDGIALSRGQHHSCLAHIKGGSQIGSNTRGAESNAHGLPEGHLREILVALEGVELRSKDVLCAS